METVTIVLAIISIANMTVLSVIITIFGKTYLKTKAQLPLGIMLFAGMMFLHNILGAYAMFDDHLNLLLHVQTLVSASSFPFALGINIAELAGLLIFLKVTWE